MKSMVAGSLFRVSGTGNGSNIRAYLRFIKPCLPLLCVIIFYFSFTIRFNHLRDHHYSSCLLLPSIFILMYPPNMPLGHPPTPLAKGEHLTCLLPIWKLDDKWFTPPEPSSLPLRTILALNTFHLGIILLFLMVTPVGKSEKVGMCI